MEKEFFQNPATDPDYSLSAFWFWNDRIMDDKTAEQLNMMHRIAADQPIIHSRFGIQNQYLSNDWFDRIQSVLETCRRNGQQVWLYDENNWPSGTCAGTITKDENNREHYLMFDTFELQNKDSWTLDLKEKNYIHVSARQHGVKPIDLLPFAVDEKILYNAKADTNICCVYIAVDPYKHGGKVSIDYLSRDAIRLFMNSTHEKYRERFSKEFGKIIKGIFMDETRFYNALPWTKTLPEEFFKRKGYDILPYLPLLIWDSEKSDFLRYDYYDVISDMYAEATYRQIYNWGEKYQMKTIGHLLGEETIAAQSYFEGDLMRIYQYLHVPALDHLGNGIGSLDAKFVSSAAHNYGKDRVACEAFGASGWDVTIEDIIRNSNWLFQQGVNMIILHAFYYSIRDQRSKDFPPSYFYQWKYWDSMPVYAAMVNRMMRMLSGGRAESEILVYTPVESFWSHFKPDLNTKTGFGTEGPQIEDKTAKLIDNQFQLLCSRLADCNLDYNILNADAVVNFKVSNKTIVNVLTGERFSIFILPVTEILPEATAKLLNEFTAAGGTVINYHSNIRHVVRKDGGNMRGCEEEKANPERYISLPTISEVLDFCRQEDALPFRILCGVDRISHSLSSYPARLIDPYIHDGERVFGIGVTRYRKDNHRILNFTNYNAKEEDLTIWVESVSNPELWIPGTGEIRQLNGVRQANGYTFSISIPQNRTYFIVCDLSLPFDN